MRWPFARGADSTAAMSQNNDIRSEEQDQVKPVVAQSNPGCGLAIYAGLLAVLGIAGMVGMAMTTYSLTKAGDQQPREMVSGTEVATWRLQPVLKAGGLAPGEVPLAMHDESPRLNGTKLCALMTDGVLYFGDGVATRLTYPAIQDITEQGSEAAGLVVTVSGGDKKLVCTFGPQEGGERFVRQTRAEMEKGAGK